MDTQPTEFNNESKNKKFLIIALVVASVVALVVGYQYYKQGGIGSFKVTLPPQEPTEAEKLLKAQSEELDRLRTAYQAQNTAPTSTIQSQSKSLNAIKNQASKQNATAPVVKKTVTEQTQELDAMRVAAKK